MFPDPLWSVLGGWIISLCFALFMLSVLALPWLRPVFSFQPLRFIGKISYSIYPWHLPILVLLATLAFSYPSFVLVSLVMVLPFCTLSSLLTERPFLQWRRVAPKPLVPEVEGAVQPS